MLAALRWALNDLRSFFNLDQQKRDKYFIAPQRNFTRQRILTFKRSTYFLFTDQVLSWYAKTNVLLKMITKNLEPVRKRDRPRNHRIMRINERHHYQHNYKSSM